MIKAKIETNDGKKIAILGLSAENIKRLIAKNYVYIDEPALFDIPIVIMYGITELDIADEIKHSYLTKGRDV